MNKNKSDTMRRPLSPVIFCTVLSLLGALNSAQAQSWRFEPVLRAGGEFDDNATLDIRTDQEVELKGYLLDLAADITYSSPATKFFAQPRFLLRNYPSEPDFDSDDIFLRSNYRYQGKFSTLGFRVNFDRQSVRTAERTDSNLDIENPDEIPNNDTARLFRFGTRDNWWFSPYWGYQLSSTSSVGLDVSYIDASYDKELEGLLDDYTDTRLSANYRRALSNVSTGVVMVTGRRYNSVGTEQDISGYGAQVGVERTLSENSRFSVMVGFEDTDPGDVNADPEAVGSITYARDLETINMFAQYRRSIVASGASTLSIRDAVSFNFKRRLSQKIAAGLGIRAYKSRSTGDVVSIDDRNYVQLQSSFSWYVTTYFAIQADYRYTVLDRSIVFGERSNSNRVNLWFVYQPQSVPKI